MNTTPPPQHQSNPWPAVLLFFAAVGVPGAAAITFANSISKNPWQAFTLALLYELSLLVLAFLQAVWKHLEETWSQDTATWVDKVVKQKWFSYTRYYGRFLTFKHRDFDIKGLSTQSSFTLEIEQVFVDVQIDPKPAHDVSANPIPPQVPQELRAGHHSLWTYLASPVLKDQHLAVLGAPGSGKTTQLKHLALTLVNPKKRRTLNRSLRQACRLPFLLFLREHVKAIQDDTAFSLEQAIQSGLEHWERAVPEGWVKRQLSQGRCLIMLDGLDEVADAATREQVVKWVQAQMLKYAQNRFLLTSRPFGYRSNPLSGVMVLEMQPFSFEQIGRFIHNWYAANEVMSSRKDDAGVRMRAKEGAHDLIRRIQQTSALSDLAVNPLLLTMIATIHRYRSTLPGKRVELYAEICEVFLGKRQQARDLPIDLRPAQCVSVLQPLAYEMMMRQQREIPSQEAQKSIEMALRLVHQQMTPQAFLQMVEQMSGLLLEREQGTYGFAHLTFQEYLAATYSREQGLEATLIAHVGESWWEETMRLYCAQTDATNVIEACLRQAIPSVPHLLLALECLEEALKVQPTMKSQLDQLLEQGAEDDDEGRRKVIAQAILKRRLKEMVPVKEGVYGDRSLITCAEYQLFLDEQRALDRYHQPDHWQKAQFPPGQALLPVVGVRFSDAQSFCEWLTEREQGVWQYRLPGPGEYPPREVSAQPAWLPTRGWSAPLAYWEVEESDLARRQLAVVQTGPTSPSAQLTLLDLDMETIDARVSVIELGKTAEWEQIMVDYLGHARDLAIAIARANASASASDLAIARALARDLTIVLDLARVEDSSTSHFLDLAQILALLSASTSCTAYRLSLLNPASQPFWKHLLALHKHKGEEEQRRTMIQSSLNRGIAIYQRLERLEKRIRGEELACEGIFIVKELKDTRNL